MDPYQLRLDDAATPPTRAERPDGRLRCLRCLWPDMVRAAGATGLRSAAARL